VKTSPKRSNSVLENKRFRLVFAKTGSIISGTGMGSETVIKSQKFSQTKYGIKLVFDFLHLTFVSFNYELCAMQTYHTYAARVFVFELCLLK